MNKPLICCLAIITSIKCFSQSSSNGFTITGKISGFSDSTLIYLSKVTDGSTVPLDSTRVIDDHFHFKGLLASSVQQVIISDKDFKNYKFLWLENAPVTFTAEKGKFREARITGSKTQDEEQKLDMAVRSGGNEKAADMEFIRRHPNSIVSANVLNVYASTWGKDTASLFYNLLSDEMKKTSYGKNIREFIQLNKDIKVGDRYVDFTQQDTAGKNVSVSDFKGKFLLLEFWGSWCGPCRANNPELVKLYREFKDKGFEILGVAADDQKKYWIDAIRKDSLPWKNVSDLKGDRNKAALIYGINKYPSSFLIDPGGTIIAVDLRGETLRNKLGEILK